MPTLFDPITIGDWQLPNRILMAPLTRARAGKERVPNALMAEYYRQRASAGLIISEATFCHVDGSRLCGDARHLVTRAGGGLETRDRGPCMRRAGKSSCNCRHVGRISDPMFLNGELPVAPERDPAGGACEHCAAQEGIRDSDGRWRGARFRGGGGVPPWRGKMRRQRASMALRFTERMDICSTNFCRIRPIIGPTNTAAPLKTARG